MPSNQLVEISQSEWPRLRELYLRDWPKNIIGFYTVDTFMRWTKQKPTINHLAICCLNGDWAEDGTYVCIHRYQLFANTLSASVDRLQIALSLLDWSRGFKVSTLYQRFRPSVLSILESRRLSITYDILTVLYYMDQDQARLLDITCPPGITLQPLSAQNAPEINDVWPGRYQNSVFLINQIIELSPSVGAFDDNGQLVAWCLRWQAGCHAALQVHKSHQRRGLGLLVCKALTKKLAEMGIDSCACVRVDNVASRKLFEHVGFRVIGKACWIQNNPDVPNEWIDQQGIFVD